MWGNWKDFNSSTMFSFQKKDNIITRIDDDRFAREPFSTDNCTSLSVGLRFNIIKLFAQNSHHSLKIGGRFGCGYWQSMSAGKDIINGGNGMEDSYWSDFFNKLLPTGGFNLRYEYSITPKITAGVFAKYESFISGAGLSIRRNF